MARSKSNSILAVRQDDGVVSLRIGDASKSTPAKVTKPKKSTSKATTPAKKKAPKTKKKVVKKAKEVNKKNPKVKKTTSKKESTSTAKKLSKKDVVASFKREPLGHLLIEHSLRDAGFRGVVSTDKKLLDEYSTDESVFSIRPQIVLQPKDQHDVETAVQVLSKETERFPSVSLTPRAAGTGLSGGSLTDSVVIDVMPYMNRIDNVQTRGDKNTITVQPGAMWKDVEKKLKRDDLYIPSYPASKDICAIGGAVGNNCAGPDSLRYGHMADWVESLNVTLHDGKTYTIKPLTYKEYKALIKKKNAHAKIAERVFKLIEKNEKVIDKSRPKTKKNSAGYALWDVLDEPIVSFKRGKGTFDLTRVISGSQGTIGVITSVTLRAEPIAHDTSLVAMPVFDLSEAGAAILAALEYDPVNVELFDQLTFDLALQNPDFFKDRLKGIDYYKVLLSLYTTYHVRYGRKIPEFTLLVTVDTKDMNEVRTMLEKIRSAGCRKARLVANPSEKEMYWQIRRASYTLSKLKDTTKRPAAFLEDMTVPPKNLAKFFTEVKRLLKKYHIEAAVHGHGGNGHLHFYPLLDFENRTTPALIEKMSEEFFNAAVKYDGNICGEHNDGIIRTPHLNKMFKKNVLTLFEELEHIFDPQDIFNPGKKVHPRFDIKDSIRKTN